MPPFRSDAQRRLFGAKVARGEISKNTFNEWQSETPAKIPERVGDSDKHKAMMKFAKSKRVTK